ncbi:reverse transcriptase domain-containing protein [Tanacetum coccineum]
MDPHTSLGRIGKKKEAKAYTFYGIESKEVCEQYITPCFVEGLDAFDGITDLKYEKNLLSNEFVVQLGLTYEVMKDGDKVVDQKLLLAKAIIDSGNGILTIWPETITIDSNDDELDALFASINIDELPPTDITDFPPFVCNMRKGPLLTVNRPKTQKELTRKELEEDLYVRIRLFNEKRPIIETLKYGDKYKMLLDSVLLDKLKLDGEFELEEEIVREQVIREYKAIKEKEDLGCFVLPIRLKGKFDFHALVDMGSNINMMPYRIYKLLDREKVKPRIDKVRMLDHSNVETMRHLLNVLCQVGVTTVLANFMLLDVPVDCDVPIIVGRSFMYACGAIMNTLNGKMTTFDGFVHQQFRVTKVRNVHEESDSDDKEEYSIKRDDFGRPVYGPHRPLYLDCEDVMDRALARQDYLDPFRNVWRNTKEEEDRKWHVSVKGVDPFGNAFEHGYKTKKTDRKASDHYKMSDIMSPDMGCAVTIEEMLEIKVIEVGGNEEVFNSKAWRHAFDINDLIYAELCHEFFSKFEFNKEVTREKLTTKKIIRSLDATSLREVIGPDGRLIAEDPAPRVPRKLYHSDRYARFFKHMAGHYGVQLEEMYVQPDYDEQH